MTRVLRIDFASKKFLNSESNKKSRATYSFSGTLFYVISENGHWTTSFTDVNENCEYRPNIMINSESFKKQKFFDFRNLLFNVGQQNKISTMTQEQTRSLNVELKDSSKFTTPLKINEFLTGSNSSGADKNKRASPMLINDSPKFKTKYKYFRFINFFKKYKIKSKKTKTKNLIKFIDLREMQEISIDQYFNEYPEIKRKFLDYNSGLGLVIDEVNNQHQPISASIDTNENNGIFLFTDNLKRVLDNTLHIEKFNEAVWRSRQRPEVRKFQEKFKITSYLDETEFPHLEHAHIIPVSHIIWSDTYNDNEKKELISDPYNCLMLEPNIHKSFDSNDFYFSDDGRAVFAENSTNAQMVQARYENLRLKKEVIDNEKIKKYLKERNEILDGEGFATARRN